MREVVLGGPPVHYVRLATPRRPPHRHDPGGSGARRALGPALVLGSSLAVQLSSSVSAGLFSTFGPLGTSNIRFAAAAVLLAFLGIAGLACVIAAGVGVTLDAGRS